jgi:hypothetical protein
MYIRFVVGQEGEDHRSLTGLLRASERLREAGRLDPYWITWLEQTYEWFNASLPIPPLSSRKWPPDVVSWFRDDAGEVITKMWELASLLTAHGVPVRLLRSTNPGKILYEDDFQAVVDEWKVL